jgi:sRNA-binding regulator protein Hfq
MASTVKTEWFGRRVSVLTVNDKTIKGVLNEVTDQYLVLTRNDSETLIMCHAVVAIRPAPTAGDEE